MLYNNTVSWLMVSRYNSSAALRSCSLTDITSSSPSSEGTFPKPLPFLYYCRRFSRVWVFLYINVCVYTCIRVYIFLYGRRAHVTSAGAVFTGAPSTISAFPPGLIYIYIYKYICVCEYGRKVGILVSPALLHPLNHPPSTRWRYIFVSSSRTPSALRFSLLVLCTFSFLILYMYRRRGYGVPCSPATSAITNPFLPSHPSPLSSNPRSPTPYYCGRRINRVSITSSSKSLLYIYISYIIWRCVTRTASTAAIMQEHSRRVSDVDPR